MSPARGGPKWRVLQRHPKAHALKQKDGRWKVFNGKECIGEGTSASASSAWLNAARDIK